MDDDEPRTATKKRALSATTMTATPSPSRRRRRRLLTGSSPGCVPRPAASGVASVASATAVTPSRALRTPPPPRRRLPPTSASSASRLATAAPPPRVARSMPTPILRLDDLELEDSDGGDDNVSTGDDAFSIISGDGSPERDRHVLDFLGFNSLGDGTPAFTLFTPSPAVSKAVGAARTVKHELTTGLLTPQASPLRTTTQKDVSPSHFFRSPYRYAKSRSHSTTSSPASLRLAEKLHNDDDDDDDADELEPEPRRSVTRSPRTPQRLRSIKDEPMPNAIVCKLPEALRSSSSTPSSASTIPWRRNSLSLMRTPSPAASNQAKALRARAHILRTTGRSPFPDDDDPSCAPSALQGASDQDWLFSFANTLSPLASGPANDEDLETSFLTLRFSPAAPSTIDLQRLLPPFPSPGLGPRDLSTVQPVPTLQTPVQLTESKPASSASSSTAPSSSSSRSSRSSLSSSSSSRELNESFPNIRASTSATPGRDERLKVSSSSVMKMKLHVTFDQFPPSHTKREIEAINNSLKRKKQARKRKLEEGKLRHAKTNSKGLNVQRKLLHTPVKEDPPASTHSKKPVDPEGVSAKPRPSRNQQALQSLKGRTTQRKLLECAEEGNEASAKAASSALQVSNQSASGVTNDKAAVADREASSSALRRRLSPTLGGVSTPTLPSSLTGTVQTPNLHPLKLRKSPAPVKHAVVLEVPMKTAEKPTPAPSCTTSHEVVPASVPKPPTIRVDPVQQKPSHSLLSAMPSQILTTTTPVKAPSLVQHKTASLPQTTGGFVASAHVLNTPVQQSAASKPTATAAPGPTGNPSKKVHCNCKKSKCLKLYCECFANGEYCDELCNCVSCCNTVAHEPVRQQAIASRLEKNPNAFKPKIELTMVAMTPGGATPSRVVTGFTTPHSGNHHHAHHHHHHAHGKGDLSGDLKKMHKHGCHCKKSGCQKRYCECFQAGVPCGENCRCIDCKNHSPYVAKNASVTTPLSTITTPGPGARELIRGNATLAAAAATPDANGDQFVSPSLPSVRQRLRIDRETWARNFSSPFEVSPRRERERTERFRAQMKNSRASALLRTFNTTNALATRPSTTDAVIKTEPGVVAAATPSSLSFRVSAAPSFASPPAPSMVQAAPKPPRSLSPLSDADRPPPAPTPHGKDSRARHMKRFMPYNPHALEALSINRKTPGRVYVLPLFGDALPPVKTQVSATIFHFLTNADVYNASLVNRLWSRVTMGDTVWDHHNFRRLPRPLLAAADEAQHHDTHGDVDMQG